MIQLVNLFHVNQSIILILTLLWALIHIYRVEKFEIFKFYQGKKYPWMKMIVNALLLCSILLIFLADVIANHFKYSFEMKKLTNLPLTWYTPRLVNPNSYQNGLILSAEIIYGIGNTLRLIGIYFLSSYWAFSVGTPDEDKSFFKSWYALSLYTVSFLCLLLSILSPFILRNSHGWSWLPVLIHLLYSIILMMFVSFTIHKVGKLTRTSQSNYDFLIYLLESHISNFYGMLVALSAEFIGGLLILLDVLVNDSNGMIQRKLYYDIVNMVHLLGICGSFSFSFSILYPSKHLYIDKSLNSTNVKKYG